MKLEYRRLMCLQSSHGDPAKSLPARLFTSGAKASSALCGDAASVEALGAIARSPHGG